MPAESNNYHHVGYHGVIHIDGAFVQGRTLEEVGAHCKGRNTQSVGYCLIGTDSFTRKQWETLANAVRATSEKFGGLRIFGHNNFSKKICPGFTVEEWLLTGMVPLKNHILSEVEGGK